MNNHYPSSRSISFTIIFLLFSIFAIGQSVDKSTVISDPQNQILSNAYLSEHLWQSLEDKWENEMVAAVATTKHEFQQFLAYNNSAFTKDKGAFFLGFSKGDISEINADAFFNGLKNKYTAIYSEFAKMKAEHPDEIAAAVKASYSQPPPSPQGVCNPSCLNIDFSNATLSAWSAYYGVDNSTTATKTIGSVTGGACGSVTQAAGPDPNTGNSYQVQLMNTGGTDPIAGPLIPLTPPLGGLCTRIGDGPVNGQGYGMLTQTFMVSASNPILTLQYAVVLENPGHTGWQQPWFQISVLDSTGTPIPGCGQYSVVSTSGLPGFKGIYYTGGSDTVYCKPWTTVFVPLYNYIGQCVTVQFEASDCALGGHIGYGYVAASCSKLNLISSSSVFCNGQQSAKILGPPGALTYQWSSSNGCISGLSTVQSITVTCAGTYNLTTSSAAGCVDTFSITIPAVTAGPPPTPCFRTDTVCSGNATHFNAACSNPISGSKFYWDFYNNGVYEDSSGTAPSWTYGAGGNYQVRLHMVTSAGCGSDTIMTVPVDSSNTLTRPTITITTKDALACGCPTNYGSVMLKFFTSGVTTKIVTTNSCTGAVITFTPPGSWGVSGGGGVSISNGSATITLNNICPGTCRFYVQPATPTTATKCSPTGWNGDTIVANVGVVGNNISSNATVSPSTCGNNNGSASVAALGGTSPYTYTWSNGLGTNSSVSGLSAGTYTITIADSAGCKGVTTVNILSLPGLSSLVTPYFVSCHGGNDGSVKVAPVGGIGPYTYKWSPNVTTADSTGGLSAGVYLITITDSGGCTGMATATINQPVQIKDTITGNFTNLPCHSGGNASVIPNGGNAPYTYLWSNGSTTQTDTGLVAGTYLITITDATGCTSHDSLKVTDLCTIKPKAIFISSDTAFCDEAGKCINFFDQSTNNPTSWTWLFPGAVPTSSTKQNPDSICYYYPGTYPVTLIASNGVGTDTLNVSPMITFRPVIQPTVTVKGGDTLVSSLALGYQWYFNGSPIAGATNSFYVCNQTGTYAVQITDSLGCNSLSGGTPLNCSVGINELNGGTGIMIYPNPAKDEFTIYGLQFTVGSTLEIYDVLGEKVYSQQLQTFPNGSGQANPKPQTINCKSFASGIYFIKIGNEKMNFVAKFVKE